MSEHDNPEPPAKMLAKVRAMLTLAENEAATKEEAEAFFGKALELMAKYGISHALLDAQKPAGLTAADKIFYVAGPYAERKATLLYHVGQALGCKGIRLGKIGPETVRIHLFGTGPDLERAEMLFTSLLLQLHRFIALDFTRDPKAYRSPRKWRGDYIRGFTVTVVDRIKASESRATSQAAQDTGPSVALVLRQRTEVVTQEFEAQYPNRVQRKTSTVPGSGFGSGLEGGQRADLGGTSLSNSSRPSLPQ